MFFNDILADAQRISVSSRPLRVGLVLSGGPAPGGHNVIAGVYDYINSAHPRSQLFGFMGGLDGLFQRKYRVVNDDLMDRFRNQGKRLEVDRFLRYYRGPTARYFGVVPFHS